MGGGLILSVLVFGTAMLTLRRRPWSPRLISWVAVALSATSAGILLGVAADKMLYESYGFGGWLRWGLLLAAGVTAPLLGAHALMSGRSLPTFLELLGPRPSRTRSVTTALFGLVLAVTTLIAAETALGFVFDPRYRDFPFASLGMAVVPFAGLMIVNRPQTGVRPIAEAVFAALLVASALYIGFNEGPDNWQSLWTCAIYLTFGVTLWQARAARIPK
jgi:glucan 1,3-beta-glucosidase